MTVAAQSAFREAALERAASPEQLDHLVSITKPLDWVLAAVIFLALAAAIAWGVLGRVPTRAPGQGILISSQGRVVEAISNASGRLGSVEVRVGESIKQGQTVAKIQQFETQQQYDNAVEVLRERERQHADLVAKTKRELSLKNQNFIKLEEAFDQIIKATQQRIQYLVVELKNYEDLLAKQFTTRRSVEDRRRELADAQQRREDTQNEILKLRAQKTDLESQRDRETQQSEFGVNDARRQVERLASLIGQNTSITSPVGGRVLEIKVSPGSVLSVGTAVISVETEGTGLEAVVYVAAERGKSVKPGMEVRLEPSTVKREEFGTMIGTVLSISDFPVTPQGMSAVLHNETLVAAFSKEGAPYEAKVRLHPDANAESGYRWAVGKGPPLLLSSGTLAKAEITTRQQRPIDLVVPLIKKMTGLDG